MSYIGRNLRNRFPLWCETRRNESSNAAMLLDALGEGFEEERVSFFQNVKATFSLEGNPTPEIGAFFRFKQLNEAYQNFKKDNQIFNSIDAEGILNGASLFLQPVYSYRDMVLSDPTRNEVVFRKKENVKLVSVVEDDTSLNAEDSHFFFRKQVVNTKNKIYLSDVFDFKNDYKKIYIKITNSKNYRSEKDAENFNNHYSIVLRGQDETRSLVEETIEIVDDGMYESKTWFKSLEPVIEENETRGGGSIEIYGITGDIKIYTAPVETNFFVQDTSTIVKISNEIGYDTLSENNIKYALTHEEYEGANISFLNYNFNSYQFGSDYKDVSAVIDADFFEETLSKRLFVDENLDPLKIESFALDKTRNKIVTIDKEFMLREYEPNRNPFTYKLINRTKEVDLAFETENQRVFLNETTKLNLFLERAKGGIQFIFVGRHTPERRLSYEENSDFNFEFLQNDLTWGDSFDYFEGVYAEDKYEEFKNIQFECSHPEVGQYDYYVYSFKNSVFTREYLNKLRTGANSEQEFKTIIESLKREINQTNVTINSYSILCEEITPSLFMQLNKNSILSVISEIEGIPIENPSVIHGHNEPIELAEDFINQKEYTVSIWFENIENNLFLSLNYEDKHYIFNINYFYDYIFFDYPTGTGVLVEDYDEVNITVNGTFDIQASKQVADGVEEIKKIRNSTWIDEVGFNYGVSREINESLNDYRHRIVNVLKGTLNIEKESFYKSLGYITAMEDVDIFRVTKTNESESVKIDITSNRIYIYHEDSLIYMNRFENLKFLKDLYDVLITFNFLNIEILEEDNAWWYKKTENLMPCSSERQKLKVKVNTQAKKISNKLIKSIKDLSGDFLNQVDEDEIVSPYNYSLENGVLHKYKLADENVTYTYENFPFIIKWLPIKSCAVTDLDFDDIIKESLYDNETYGNAVNDIEKSTEKLLSQNGSVIINKILHKQNTYWGE